MKNKFYVLLFITVIISIQIVFPEAGLFSKNSNCALPLDSISYIYGTKLPIIPLINSYDDERPLKGNFTDGNKNNKTDIKTDTKPKKNDETALITKISITKLQEVITGMNVNVQNQKSNDGTTYLKLTMNDLNSAVFLAEPSGNEYAKIHLFAAFRINMTKEQVSSWNSQNPGTEAYIDKDGDAVITSELSLAKGVTKEQITGFVKNFGDLVVKFNNYK